MKKKKSLNDEYEKGMTEAEKAEQEVYIKEMWQNHKKTVARLGEGFSTQSPEEFRENMRGFWRLNHQHRPWQKKQ